MLAACGSSLPAPGLDISSEEIACLERAGYPSSGGDLVRAIALGPEKSSADRVKTVVGCLEDSTFRQLWIPQPLRGSPHEEITECILVAASKVEDLRKVYLEALDASQDNPVSEEAERYLRETYSCNLYGMPAADW